MNRDQAQKSQVWVHAGDADSFGEVLSALLAHRVIYLRHPGDLSGLLKKLTESGYGSCAVCVCARPGSGGKRVSRGSAAEFSARAFSDQVSALLKWSGGRKYFSEIWKSSAECPENIREAVRAEIALLPGERAYLLGNGAEAFAEILTADAGDGDVYVIPEDDEAVRGLQAEAEGHGRRNLHAVRGDLPEALGHFPGADAVLVTETDAPHRDLIQIAASRNPDVRVVVVTDSFELAARDFTMMEHLGFAPSLRSIEAAEDESGSPRTSFSGRIRILAGRRSTGQTGRGNIGQSLDRSGKSK